MDHPLLSDDQKDLRRRVVQFFHNSYKVLRESNFIFVCGGNEATQLRPLFRTYCEVSRCKYEIFQPEFAMENIFATGLREPFDITDFEQLVGSLSHAIVIFPEAAGSFAETGYFSAIPELATKTILVLDSERQKDDSFISLGPAKKINEKSIFTPVIQMDYSLPKFELVITRIDSRAPISDYKKLLSWKELSDLSDYEFLCLIYEIVNFLQIATLQDLEFMLRAMSSAHLSVSRLQQLASILVGAGYLERFGEYGHLKVRSGKTPLLSVKDGEVQLYGELGIELATVYLDADSEFKRVLGSL